MQHVVKVWGKPYTIEVHQNSKTVWVAVGDYMGEIREVKGGSANDAISQWKEWARYNGN